MVALHFHAKQAGESRKQAGSVSSRGVAIEERMAADWKRI
jgi:hypothetical protein